MTGYCFLENNAGYNQWDKKRPRDGRLVMGRDDEPVRGPRSDGVWLMVFLISILSHPNLTLLIPLPDPRQKQPPGDVIRSAAGAPGCPRALRRALFVGHVMAPHHVADHHRAGPGDP